MQTIRRAVLAVVVLALTSVSVWAQSSLRVYVVPRIGDGLSRQTAFKPKYVNPGDLGVGLDLDGWVGIDYGSEGVFFLFAAVTAEQHTALSAQTDVLAVPANLDTTISALALTTIQTKLEAANLPADWVTTSMTYRTVLRTLLKIAQIAQRYTGLFGTAPMWPAGVTLDTRWNQLTQAQQSRLLQVAQSFNLDTTGVTNTMTLRQIYRALADQLPAVHVSSFAFAEEVF